jgi:hypothetical protein
MWSHRGKGDITFGKSRPLGYIRGVFSLLPAICRTSRISKQSIPKKTGVTDL